MSPSPTVTGRRSAWSALPALVAGTLMVAAQLVMWPFDTEDHVATTQSVVFQVAGVAYFLGFCGLALTVVTSYAWQAEEAGRLGALAASLALVGTLALGGDLWFETFAVPWLADETPAALSTEPTLLLALGAVGSYALFSLGWTAYGLAGLRAGVLPRSISTGIAVGGVLGFSALLAPYGIPLGLAVLALGVWMLRMGERPEPRSAGYVGPGVGGPTPRRR